MPSLDILLLFIPTFFLVSITPGMCMTLALSLGMSIGVRRTLWMMLGELIGVATVAVSAILGIALLMNQHALVFFFFKLIGASYLFYLAFQMYRSNSKLSLSFETTPIQTSRLTLFSQGFFTAIANPKGWAFMMSLLPPFINSEQPLAFQLFILVGIIMCTELTCMLIYANGGKSVARFAKSPSHIERLNRISALLMAFVAIWLLMS